MVWSLEFRVWSVDLSVFDFDLKVYNSESIVSEVRGKSLEFGV